MNLSNPKQIDCFFFLENEPTVGTCIEMEITIPQEMAGSAPAKIHCQGKVVQVEKGKAEGRTGVICTIENYRYIPAAADVELAE